MEDLLDLLVFCHIYSLQMREEVSICAFTPLITCQMHYNSQLFRQFPTDKHMNVALLACQTHNNSAWLYILHQTIDYDRSSTINCRKETGGKMPLIFSLTNIPFHLANISRKLSCLWPPQLEPCPMRDPQEGFHCLVSMSGESSVARGQCPLTYSIQFFIVGL